MSEIDQSAARFCEKQLSQTASTQPEPRKHTISRGVARVPGRIDQGRNRALKHFAGPVGEGESDQPVPGAIL